MARKKLAGALLALVLVLLTGCTPLNMQNITELLRAPALSPGQDEIQKALIAHLGDLEPQYKFPKGGDWLSPLLRADLDGDGSEEAVLLYSLADNVNAAREKGNNVYVAVLEHGQEGWQVTQDVQGLSTDVASLEVADLLDDGTRQLIVGFATSTFNAKTLALYTYQDHILTQVEQFDYSRYEIGDFTGRGGNDLVVVSRDDEPGKLQLRYLRTQGGRFVTDEKTEPVQLDENFTSCASIAPSHSSEGPMLVVDGMTKTLGLSSQLVFYNGERFYTWENESLRGDTARFNALLTSRDVDGDGVVEIPVRHGNLPITTLRADKNMEFVKWMDYSNVDADPVQKQFGLLDSDRGVYIRFPESWRDSIAVADGTGNVAWQVQRRSTSAALLSLHVLEAGDTPPAGAAPVPGITNTYLQYHGGIPTAERDIITMTSLL